MRNTFNTFSSIQNLYPNPVKNIQFSKSQTFPTNSWFENAFTDKIDDQNRVGNAIPWKWGLNYSSSTISIGYANTKNMIITTTRGNLQLGEVTGDSYNIIVGSQTKNNLTITNFDDFTAELTQTNTSGSVKAYPMRGSPYASFFYNNTPIFINFIQYPNITNFTQISLKNSLVNYCYLVQANDVYSTVFNTGLRPENLLDQNPTQFTLKEFSFYDGPNNTGWNINVSFNTISNVIQYTINLPYNICLNFNITLNSITQPVFPTNQYISSITYSCPNLYTPQITILTNDNKVFVVSLCLSQTSIPMTATAVYSHPQIYQFAIFTSAILNNNNNIITSSNPYNGLLQIACFGRDSTLFSTFQQLYSKYAGGYAISGNITNWSCGINDNNWTFNINWNLSSNNILWLAPNHWNLLKLNGISNINSENNPLIQNFIYGNLTWFNITNNITNVIVSTSNIPLSPDISCFTQQQKNMLKNQIILDLPIVYNSLPGHIDQVSNIDYSTFSDAPYPYGNVAASLARILFLAQSLGMNSNDSQFISLGLNSLHNTLVAYMEGINYSSAPSPNTNAFQLQYEPTWGGIIVPCDYYMIAGNPNCPGNPLATVGSFGNSTYNDHHFHWGYLLYALYILNLLGDNTISQKYVNQITALITDIVNPSVTNFSWKTRYKDWYGGHSFATGVQGDVMRQQESSGEAINGYYAAYLMSNLLQNNNLKSCAGCCLWTEIMASQQYYAFGATGTQFSIFNNTGNIGLLQTFEKDFTLDWGMQPDTFNGRAIGMYGIQTLPYTEITFNLINPDWVTSLTNINPSYALTPQLILGLLNKIYSPIPTPNEDISYDTFDVTTQGIYWGLVGLKILSFSKQAITDTDIQTGYSTALSQQINNNIVPLFKQFDSFTNTLYLLFKLNRNIVIDLLK